MKDYLRDMVARRKRGEDCGIGSYCTANELVIEACMQRAQRDRQVVLMEATANQVNQFGGYTGMRPSDFRDFVYGIADRIGFAREDILLGGDHLGPLTWQNESETEAMNYLAPCGIVAPEYYDAQGTRWLRNFFVGMLTTCGLQHFGNPRIKDGEELGLHGRIANTPAENVKYARDVRGETHTLTLEGTMREARIFGENLTLHRKLEFAYGEDSILLTDTITNHGFGDRQVLYALHLNYGYPLLEEGCKLILDTEETKPREENAARHLATWQQIEAPQYPYPERCYFHRLRRDADGMARNSSITSRS